MCAAPAKVRIKFLRDAGPVHLFAFVQQGAGTHQDAGQAVAALSRLMIKESRQ